MFRNPRESGSNDVGRPPTPPGTRKDPATAAPAMAAQPSPALPRIGRQPAPRPSPAKGKAGGNGSILSFFKKAEPEAAPVETDENLFLSEDESAQARSGPLSAGTAPRKSFGSGLLETDQRYHEDEGSAKRRRLSDAFAEEADGTVRSDELVKRPILQDLNVANVGNSVDDRARDTESTHGKSTGDGDELPSIARPALVHQPTSAFGDEFDGIEDFADDEFPEDGEETMERRFMEEQRRLERDFESDDEGTPDIEARGSEGPPANDGEQVPECPVCGRSLKGLDDSKASQHVNDCLDGKTVEIKEEDEPSPNVPEVPPVTEPSVKVPAKRFQRAAIARPAQANPFSLDAGSARTSAFSKIMASHAEDSAWATAAANETAARGKPAFKRTCPFYKILPGFFICVDAFRYGAVEGCHAYFLSHFHSDHYIGLTSSWCHGPIYCSRVTGNLVRQQLRVDPKWVVDLDWETKAEVPRTQGVHVTMIPANHCPGSSLFLFEKDISRGGNSKLQRVLHCGDFRACVAHVQHPLLRPAVLDAVTGKSRQQKLDVCYLDTTYLTPKYAFPRQDDVVQACADMCLSLSKDRADTNDSYEQMKRQRAGEGMVKFVKQGTADATEGGEGGSADTAAKSRGRLLVVVGTYSIGKERLCLRIAKALDSKIFAPPGKLRICSALEDAELSARLTGDPLAAQVHMQMLMEIRAETLADYLTGYKPHFSRVVGFRPTGWNYRPPNSRFVESPAVQTVLHSDNWRPSYSVKDLVPQRGSTRESSCFGVPYSEHSSFRELTMFCCALHIDKIIPTVNVGSAKSRERMKVWIERWSQEKRKNGLFKVADDAQTW